MARSLYCTNIKCGGITSDQEAEGCYRCFAPMTSDIDERGVYYSPEELAEFREWIEKQVR